MNHPLMLTKLAQVSETRAMVHETTTEEEAPLAITV